MSTNVYSVSGNSSGSLSQVSWSTGSDAQIVAAVAAAYRGEINLMTDYGWAIGDERTVHLSAMPKGDLVNYDQPEQDVTFVLMAGSIYKLSDGVTSCQFVVGMKNILSVKDVMCKNSSGSFPWVNSPRRTWCNTTFYEAVPVTLRPIFKKFTCVRGGTGTSIYTSLDYFALPAAFEVGGTGGNASEQAAVVQLPYYLISTNRVKRDATGNAVEYFTSSGYTNTGNYYNVTQGGSPGSYQSQRNEIGISPFGVI